MIIMTVNSKTKHKFKIMLGVIRTLVLDFIIYFVIAYMRKYPVHVTSALDATQNTLYLKKKVKNLSLQTIYNNNYTQKMFRLLQ